MVTLDHTLEEKSLFQMVKQTIIDVYAENKF